MPLEPKLPIARDIDGLRKAFSIVPVERMRAVMMSRAMKAANGNQCLAAELAGISRMTLRRQLAKSKQSKEVK